MLNSTLKTPSGGEIYASFTHIGAQQVLEWQDLLILFGNSSELDIKFLGSEGGSGFRCCLCVLG